MSMVLLDWVVGGTLAVVMGYLIARWLRRKAGGGRIRRGPSVDARSGAATSPGAPDAETDRMRCKPQ